MKSRPWKNVRPLCPEIRGWNPHAALQTAGMDALRGGFGAVGSIIRARSVKRSMSSTSGQGLPFHNSGWDGMPRYQRTLESLAVLMDDGVDAFLASLGCANPRGCGG